jgi:lipase chaperone LimK
VTAARRRAVAILVVVAAVAVAALWRTPAPVAGGPVETMAASRPANTGPIPSRAATPPPAAPRPATVASAATPPVPSQVGSEADGSVELDGDGRLRVDRALRHFFDWHRAAAGELDENAIRQRLAASLQARLPPAQAAEALAIYDRYLDYLAASDSLPFSGDPLTHFDALRALRRDLLGDAIATAFFADDEVAIEARLIRRALLSDRSLDAAERERRLAAIDAALPVELRPSPEVLALADAEALDALFEAGGIDPPQRHEERAARFGEDAAVALGQLDRERADWQERVGRYLALERRLGSDLALSAAERQHRLDRWLQQHFGAAEQRRLRALRDEGLLAPDGG